MKKYLCIWFKMYKLRDWVDKKRLKGGMLSCNERAIEYLENHERKIDHFYILLNEEAIHIIEKIIKNNKYNSNNHMYGEINNNKNAVNFLRNNRHHMDYTRLCAKEHGIEFVDELIKNNELDKIHWGTLSSNPAAMHILNDPKYYQYINWCGIIYNKNAVELVKNNLHMVRKYWGSICALPHLIDIIEQNMDKIDWGRLSINYNAIHILEKNIGKIDRGNLRLNKNGFQLLLKLHEVFGDNHYTHYHKNIIFDYFDYCEKNNMTFNLIYLLSEYGYTEKHMEFLKHNNNYYKLSRNPNIFEYDYKRMRETRQALPWYNDIKK